jgi:hypothetical protein
MTTVTVEDLRAAKWVFAMHLNMGSQGHQYAYTSDAFPEATINKGWTRERQKGATRESWSVMRVKVGSSIQEAPLAELEECAKLISKARQLIADDEAWNAAEPTQATQKEAP